MPRGPRATPAGWGQGAPNPPADVVEVLADLLRAEPRPPRALLLAFDYRHGLDGAPIEERSEFYVPNDYVLGVRDADPDVFLAAASIHPYREDAIAELERVHAAGVRVLKWLPSAQGIDLAHERCQPFFAACARLDVTLLIHAGAEQAGGARPGLPGAVLGNVEPHVPAQRPGVQLRQVPALPAADVDDHGGGAPGLLGDQPALYVVVVVAQLPDARARGSEYRIGNRRRCRREWRLPESGW